MSRDPSHVRRHFGPDGPLSLGVAPVAARLRASHQLERSSSNSSAIADCIRSEKAWWVSPSLGLSGPPYRMRIGGRPGLGQNRPFGIAAYAPMMAIGTTGMSMSMARRALP
jgi:hypothetical protein